MVKDDLQRSRTVAGSPASSAGNPNACFAGAADDSISSGTDAAGTAIALADGESGQGRPAAWWKEPHAWSVLLLVLAIYFVRLGAPTLQGEETRRALVAEEMLRTGDWIVPREQGVLFPDRPPLGNWTIALVRAVSGSREAWAVRLPSALATLLTTWLVYVYARASLSSLGAAASACAYATLGQVLQLGRLAETEAVFTLLVAASLLGWHLAWERLWRLGAWMVGYGFAGLAALAKGPQGPIYFVCAAVGWLALKREWREIVSWRHLAGCMVGVAIVAAWHVPYARAVEWPLVLQTWGGLATARFDYSEPAEVLWHLVRFPVEILVCLLPWSLLLAAYALQRPRRALDRGPAQVPYLLLAIGLAFLTCWLAPQARGRYFMPLYPCFCPLIGLAIERALQVPDSVWQQAWRRFCTGAAAVAVAAGVGLLAVALLGWVLSRPRTIGADWTARAKWAPALQAQPLWFGFGYAAVAILAAVLAWRARGCKPRDATACVFGLAAFLGLTYVGALVNSQVHAQNDVAAAVARVKRRIPEGERLVSLGKAYHRFVYWYGEPVEVVDPAQAALRNGDWRYFCFHLAGLQARPEVPFAYEELAVVPCDRRRDQPLYDRVVVARRLDVAPRADKSVPNRSRTRR